MKRAFAILLGFAFIATLLLCPSLMTHAEHVHDMGDAFAAVDMHVDSVKDLSTAIFFFVSIVALAALALFAWREGVGIDLASTPESARARWHFHSHEPPAIRTRLHSWLALFELSPSFA